MFVGAAGHVRYVGGYFPTGAVPLIGIGALSLVGAAWLRLAIGALLPSPRTAPMLVVVGFIGLALLPPTLFPVVRGWSGTAGEGRCPVGALRSGLRHALGRGGAPRITDGGR